jgi:hypothetical protein
MFQTKCILYSLKLRTKTAISYTAFRANYSRWSEFLVYLSRSFRKFKSVEQPVPSLNCKYGSAVLAKLRTATGAAAAALGLGDDDASRRGGRRADQRRY